MYLAGFNRSFVSLILEFVFGPVKMKSYSYCKNSLGGHNCNSIYIPQLNGLAECVCDLT